ncbi:hypothetical protein [Streptomyces sp. NPDC093589]|uniref:hypothetical protein n=1 Tax=Streptomyces sp. NPDC093589 TaxID=3366043 RepID=UPI00380D7162
MQTTALAPAFHVTHDTIAGPIVDSIHTVKNDTWVTATVTITGERHYGTGNSQRARLVLTAENGTMIGATVTADRFPRLIDALVLADGTPVQVRGLVRHTPGIPTVLEVTGIAPAA